MNSAHNRSCGHCHARMTGLKETLRQLTDQREDLVKEIQHLKLCIYVYSYQQEGELLLPPPSVGHSLVGPGPSGGATSGPYTMQVEQRGSAPRTRTPPGFQPLPTALSSSTNASERPSGIGERKEHPRRSLCPPPGFATVGQSSPHGLTEPSPRPGTGTPQNSNVTSAAAVAAAENDDSSPNYSYDSDDSTGPTEANIEMSDAERKRRVYAAFNSRGLHKTDAQIDKLVSLPSRVRRQAELKMFSPDSDDDDNDDKNKADNKTPGDR